MKLSSYCSLDLKMIIFYRMHALLKFPESWPFNDFSTVSLISATPLAGRGRVERRCWVNFQCRGVLLVWMVVGKGPIALAVGAGGGCLVIFFSHLSFLLSFSLSLGDGPI